MTRSNRRPLVAFALAACAAVATGLLSACGSGQIAQTAQVAPAVPGANTQATVPGPDGKADGTLFVRDVAVNYRETKGYPSGASAPLSLWIFSTAQHPVRLVGVTAAQQAGDQSTPAQVVLSDGSATAADTTSASAPPCVVPRSLAPSAPQSPTSPSPTPVTAGGSPSAHGSASSSGSASGSASASSSASASASVKPSSSPSPAASPSPSPAGATTIDISIPAGGCVELSPRAAHYLQLVNLPQALGNANTVRMTFQFSTSDGQQFTVGDPQDAGKPLQVPVGVPASALPRTSITPAS